MENYLEAVQGYIERAQARREAISKTMEEINSIGGPSLKGGGGSPSGRGGSGGTLRGAGSGHAVMPIQGAGFTAGSAGDFGPRVNPVTGVNSPHTGYDFSAGQGTKIRAAVGGRVVSAGWDPIYGWETIIKSKNGYTTQYAHQVRDPKKLSPGTKVKAGQVIGRVGSTGRSTGAHLHFGVQNKQGQWVDPMKWLDKLLGRK